METPCYDKTFDNQVLTFQTPIRINIAGLGLSTKCISQNTPYLATPNDVILIGCSTEHDINITLPCDTCPSTYIIKNTGDFSTVISATGGTIEGQAELILCRKEEVVQLTRYECECSSSNSTQCNYVITNEKLDRLLTTKGDIFVRGEHCIEKLPVGNDCQFLASCSASPLGVAWKNLEDCLDNPTPPIARLAYTPIQYTIAAIDEDYITVGIFPFSLIRHSLYVGGRFVLHTLNTDIDNQLDIRLLADFDSSVLADETISTSTTLSFPFIQPTNNTQILIQVSKVSILENPPMFAGMSFEFIAPLSKLNFALLNVPVLPTAPTTPVGYFPWIFPRYAAFPSGVVILMGNTFTALIDIELFDETNAVSVASITTTMTDNTPIILPFTNTFAGSARLSLRLFYNGISPDIQPIVYTAQMELNANNFFTSYTLLTDMFLADSLDWVECGNMPYSNALYGTFTNPIITLEIEIEPNSSAIDVQLWDEKTNTIIASASYVASDFYTINVGAIPATAEHLQLRARRQTVIGLPPRIIGANIQFTRM